ncbi:MAG: response regulator [Planctomycetota bacterium]
MPETARRVLLIDDEPHISSILDRRFTMAGWTTAIAKNGREAMDMLEPPPDVVIVDYQMPTMDGLETAEALATHDATRHAPIIMLTARGHLVDQDRVAATNIRTLLPKPFSAREVIAAADDLVNNADSEAAA